MKDAGMTSAYNNLLAESYARNFGLLANTLEDFSDAEMLIRPCAGANHAAWQVGHLICAENSMIEGCAPGSGVILPMGFAEKFNSSTATIDDPTFFPSKSELIAQLKAVRDASIAWVKALTESELTKPGPEKMLAYLPTVGLTAVTLPEHLMMHLGQLQVIRRALGKKLLF